MSSLPSEEGVAILRDAAATAHSNAKEEERLREQIADLTRKLDAVVQVKVRAQRSIIEQLNKMDCASSGNNGWDRRIIWMLGELAIQAEEHGRRHP